jgi:antitoxin ParD1/3/4
MPTRNVVLADYQASLVKQLVDSGCYENASEVLREALRSAVQVGIEEITAGRFKSFKKKESLRAHLKSITDKATAWISPSIFPKTTNNKISPALHH